MNIRSTEQLLSLGKIEFEAISSDQLDSLIKVIRYADEESANIFFKNLFQYVNISKISLKFFNLYMCYVDVYCDNLGFFVKNPDCPYYILEELFKIKPSTIIYIAHNPNISINLYDQFVEQKYDCILANPKLSSTDLSRIYALNQARIQNDTSIELYNSARGMVQNPNCSEELLYELSGKLKDIGSLGTIVLNNKLNLETRLKAYMRFNTLSENNRFSYYSMIHGLISVNEKLLKSKKTPLELLLQIREEDLQDTVKNHPNFQSTASMILDRLKKA